MKMEEEEDNAIYKVVVNHEEQYSIWPADRENALGWNNAGKTGLKTECLAYIKEVWTDMRPLSLRKKMKEASKKKQERTQYFRICRRGPPQNIFMLSIFPSCAY